jgi:phosphoribosyl 1,2-cyclic phosphate phosphodiesterase
MKITFLGTGTADGSPVIGCKCKVCRSFNAKNRRLRAGLFIEDSVNNVKLLVESSPDLRYQALRYNISYFDALLISHAHYDHTAGLPELRRFNFIMHKDIDLYANKVALDELKHNYHYFFDSIQQGGGLPHLLFNEVNGPFTIKGCTIIPLAVKHGLLDIIGYRVGNFAYITDASLIANETLALLHNLEVLVLNALRIKPHPTHFCAEEAVAMAKKIGAKRSYFTHIDHTLGYSVFKKMLAKTMYVAYDGLVIDV